MNGDDKKNGNGNGNGVGNEAHAIKVTGGIKSIDSSDMGILTGRKAQKEREELRRVREAEKITKQQIDLVDDKIKEEKQAYRMGERTAEKRAQYKATLEALNKFRDQILNRTKTEQPPKERNWMVRFGVNEDEKRKAVRQDVAGDAVSASGKRLPFQAYVETVDPETTRIRLQAGQLYYGINATPITITGLDVPINIAIAAGTYIYIVVELDSDLQVTDCYLQSGDVWNDYPKYIYVNADDEYAPFQQYLYSPLAKVMPLVDGGPTYDVKLTDATQLYQLAKSDVRLELWTVDGLPMWIPSPGVVVNPPL
jgi:hypothetical protein